MTSFSGTLNQDLEQARKVNGSLKFLEIKVQKWRVIMFEIDCKLARYLGKTCLCTKIYRASGRSRKKSQILRDFQGKTADFAGIFGASFAENNW